MGGANAINLVSRFKLKLRSFRAMNGVAFSCSAGDTLAANTSIIPSNTGSLFRGSKHLANPRWKPLSAEKLRFFKSAMFYDDTVCIKMLVSKQFSASLPLIIRYIGDSVS